MSDDIIDLIQSIKCLVRDTLGTDEPRPKTFKALDEAESVAGWELADIQTAREKS